MNYSNTIKTNSARAAIVRSMGGEFGGNDSLQIPLLSTGTQFGAARHLGAERKGMLTAHARLGEGGLTSRIT